MGAHLAQHSVELQLGPAVHPAPGTQVLDEPERILELVARNYGGAGKLQSLSIEQHRQLASETVAFLHDVALFPELKAVEATTSSCAKVITKCRETVGEYP